MMNLINKKAQIDNETMASMAQKLLDLLISAGIGATATSSEMIINRMIRSMTDVYKRPDLDEVVEDENGNLVPVDPPQIITARQALEKNMSPYIGLSYQNIKRQMISDDLYTKRNESSYVDPLFDEKVPMDKLKEYDRLIDQNYRRACQEDRRRLYEETFYNPAYVKSFMEEFDKHEKQ